MLKSGIFVSKNFLQQPKQKNFFSSYYNLAKAFYQKNSFKRLNKFLQETILKKYDRQSFS